MLSLLSVCFENDGSDFSLFAGWILDYYAQLHTLILPFWTACSIFRV